MRTNSIIILNIVVMVSCININYFHVRGKRIESNKKTLLHHNVEESHKTLNPCRNPPLLNGLSGIGVTRNILTMEYKTSLFEI